jgi:hypothetical protein
MRLRVSRDVQELVWYKRLLQVAGVSSGRLVSVGHCVVNRGGMRTVGESGRCDSAAWGAPEKDAFRLCSRFWAGRFLEAV